ncbi:hypothetical protein JR334_02910 [Clostridia bacterium]|nr:hypothetical protein JR334_02910 [Clostridia bacterium]
MATFLGWLNIVLILYLVSLFLIKRYISWKGRNITTSMKLITIKISRFHKIAAMALLMLGLVHGYLAQGNQLIINHSGFLLWIIVLTTTVVGMINENTDNEKLRKLHVQYAFLLIVVLLYHYFYSGPIIG